jgi:hypothetical protein
MDLFDVHRRDVYNFDQYMDLKKPGFGGNDSLIYDRDGNGKKTSESSDKLKDYRRVVKRDPLFKNPHYNSTYKAMSHDLVYKQEGEKPVTYPDPYLTGIATVEVGEYETNESVHTSFNSFLNESKITNGSIKSTVKIDDNVIKALKEEAAKIEAMKKERAKALSEGKCQNFNQFMSISEQWEDMELMYADTETETETEPDIEIEEPEVIPGEGPENPPRRRVNPAPKNSLEKAVQDLMNYAGISRKEAEDILAIDIIRDLENADTETEEPEIEIEEPEVIPGEGPENPPRRRVNPAPKNKYDELDDILDAYGEGPDCYGEGPGCGGY